MTLWVICVAFCAISTDFVFDVSPSLKLPFEFRVFTTRLDIFSSNRLPTTFTWGNYHVEAYFGRRPRPESMSSAVVDYASHSAGGRTVKALTSATYSLAQRNLYGIFSKVRKDHSPAVALMDGLEPGQCWAFQGQAGQLGIQFTHAIRVSSLVVGHANISYTASAPKKLVLWGLKPTSSNLCTGDADTPLPDFGFGYCGIRLLSVIHEPSSETLYQNFTITPVSSQYFDHLIVHILENWGHPGFTCIYRIQIYGSI